jgi:hypothetical protein
MLSSAVKVLRSSSMFMMEGWRTMTLLMVLTGDMEPAVLAYEWRVLVERELADEDRRKEVRRLCGEKRAVMAWKRDEDCILAIGGGWRVFSKGRLAKDFARRRGRLGIKRGVAVEVVVEVALG